MNSAKRGFALIITVSLMILLSLLAVGLLTLSSITLRSSTQGESMAMARANARMALMMAIGQLQKTAGSDQRVTARADLLDENIANPRLTGVWNSWEIKADSPPSASEFEKDSKNDKFRTWLVSGADAAQVTQTSFASEEIEDPATLWGEGSLGPGPEPKDLVRAGKVPITNPPGSMAWAVLDEGVKARINTAHDDIAASDGAKTAQLGAGERPGTEFIEGLGDLKRDFFEKEAPEFATLQKGISGLTFGLAGDSLASGVREALQPLTHDVTTYSTGLFTDTARGGLKQDFHLLSNREDLPSEFQGTGIYRSRLDLSKADAPSDPSWESLHEFSRLYREQVTISNGAPAVAAQAPRRWEAGTQRRGTTDVTVNLEPPPGVVLMPTIAKVQMVFSLIGRDIYNHPYFPPGPAPERVPDTAGNMHGPQDGHFRDTKYDYDLHLLYTPVVTLHNPYNVALEFKNMRVEFVHVPFAMQVFRNGQRQSTGLVPLETMYGDNSDGRKSKIFGMNLKTSRNGRPRDANFTLLPGEVKMFSPYIDPNRTYQQDLGGRQFWDIFVDTKITNDIDAIPGWRGDGIGFDCDWLAGAMRVDGNKEAGRWESCFGLAADDEIHVEFAPLSVPISKNKFVIRMAASTGRSNATSTVSVVEIDYERPTGLQDTILGRGQTLRFPSEGTVRGSDLIDHSTRRVKDIVNVKPFAVLSAQAKTTSGGRDVSNKDGRIAAKPWSFAHGSIGTSTQKLIAEHPAGHSHEIDLQLLDLGRGTTDIIPIDQQDRGTFVTGHTTLNGSKFGVMYDVPLAPVQGLAGLNGANPGGSSGYLPRFAQPIGNSWAHPLLSPDRITQGGSGGPYVDHSFLLNLALYDSFYFSGFGDQIGAYGSGREASSLAAAFAAGEPLDDPRILLHRPDSRPATDLEEVIQEDEAYAEIAAWQMMDGAFNINSTSVAAWKAMLASVHDPESLVNLVSPGDDATRISTLDATGDREARISRFRLPASTSADDGTDSRLAYWLGPREYSDEELEELAERIVEQVRQRGPFLSMGEFVNRRLGSDETAQRGALQQAIDESNLNRSLANDADAGFEIPVSQVADYKYANPEAGAGSSYQGGPGYLSQADLLNVLGNAATPRSDTFVIRGYGEARDNDDRVIASATCEAVVQRMPEWVDSRDAVEARPDELTSESNKTFGRRFIVRSFRWLNPREV